MTWRKLGRIFEPEGDSGWSTSHAQLPVALHLRDSRYRIFYGTRNDENMTQVSYVEVDVEAPHEPLARATEPVLELGPLGTFDDSGVYPSSVVRAPDGRTHLYYIGWMQGERVSYYAAVGLATSTDGEHFEKAPPAPHLSRSSVDPYMTLSSCVRRYGDDWRMWYTTATEWEEYEGGVRPNYHVKYAESDDGLEWDRDGTVAIHYESADEWAIACPTVLRDGDRWHMWYSYVRGDRGYRIGYATSSDGVHWERRDGEAGIEPSSDGWDSEMQAYPHVFEHGEDRYLLYNGNDYGRDGFGLAVWDGDLS